MPRHPDAAHGEGDGVLPLEALDLSLVTTVQSSSSTGSDAADASADGQGHAGLIRGPVAG
ncbi:hypothetical protein [Glutamicibacter arilaitensis]|uniref:hypothetical protein n=1 Tax=Glutamicibacter arilaitensis TaxID=256701 RepID=UPI003A91E948